MDHSKNIYPLFNSSDFHDACGTGFIVTLSGKPEKRVLPLALKGLQRLDHRGISHEITLLKKVRLEIAVNDEFVDAVIEAVTIVAKKDGDKGRGKIFILPIDDCIRLRTGEKGSEAIG